MRRFWGVIGALIIGSGLVIVPASPAHAVDVPIGQTVFQSAFSGCKVRIEGRNVDWYPGYSKYQSGAYTLHGPMVSWRLLSNNNGGIQCTGIRFNYVVNCPSLFFFGWVFNGPEQVEDVPGKWIQMQNRDFFVPFIVTYPTCQFFGMWIEMDGGPYGRICQVYDVINGWYGDPCTGHGTGSSYHDPTEYWHNPA